jgi:hypothetical protein
MACGDFQSINMAINGRDEYVELAAQAIVQMWDKIDEPNDSLLREAADLAREMYASEAEARGWS